MLRATPYILRIFLVSLVLGLAPKPAPAMHAGVPHQNAADLLFSEIERRLVHDYYDRQREAESKKGKAKKAKGLPPGIAKKVARGGALPPGIAKRYLPSDLDRTLPRAYPGTERRIVGDDVVLVQTATNLILDIIEGALATPPVARR